MKAQYIPVSHNLNTLHAMVPYMGPTERPHGKSKVIPQLGRIPYSRNFSRLKFSQVKFFVDWPWIFKVKIFAVARTQAPPTSR